MIPALQPGDGLLTTAFWPVRTGQIRCLPDPEHPNRWLVKRVSAIDSDGSIRFSSDNRSLPTRDSREFGSVPASGTYRVLVRLPARLLR